jgi:TonB family protein
MNRALLAAACVSFAALAEDVFPPQPIDTPAAVAPPGATAGAIVGLLVTVGVDGNVQDAAVDVSGGPAFDAAALEAVKKWRFRPALRNGVPFASRVRIPFRFVPENAAGLAALPPEVPDAGVVAEAPDAGPAPEQAGAIGEVNVRGRQRKIDRGGSDFQIDVGQLAIIPRKNAEDLLNLAPGIFLANEGGEGHAEQVFLRGFNAESGNGIEFSLNGVPINEVNNPDAHGYADTHFIIPELIKSLQVTEGPFDPHQGDFAIAGSARYELGVKERGLRVEALAGSYGTRRYLGIWAPKGQHEGTLGAFEYRTTDGFGVNRAAAHASAIAQYEGDLGNRGFYRLLGTFYTTHFKTAGVVRKDDVDAGLLGPEGFHGSEDTSQGGDAQRATLSFDLESPMGDGVGTQQVFLTYRNLRIVENFTGFLLDTQEFGQSLHPQRGDAVEKTYQAITAGGRGGYRVRTKWFDREQSVELGYFARYDHTSPEVQRLRFGTQIPYLINSTLQTDVFNVAGYLDAEIRPLSFLTLRGGVREEYFAYNVLDLCATNGFYPPTGNLPLDVNCPPRDPGPRQPTRRVVASGDYLAPKLTALVALPYDLTFTASYGLGSESRDAQYVSQDEKSPIVQLRAAEAGLIYRRRIDQIDLTARALGYYTHVDQDLVFDPNLGRQSAAAGTTRIGAVAAVRAIGRWFDEAASITTTNPRFDDTKSLVPYTPLVLARSDTAVFGFLPGGLRLFEERLTGEAGLAISYIGKRSLPFSQFSDPTLQVDASLAIRGGPVKLGVHVTNLTNAQFPLSQFFYPSSFCQPTPGVAACSRAGHNYPTLAPAAHFTAAAPRIILFTLEVDLEREH